MNIRHKQVMQFLAFSYKFLKFYTEAERFFRFASGHQILFNESLSLAMKSFETFRTLKPLKSYNATHNRTQKAERSVAFCGPSLCDC